MDIAAVYVRSIGEMTLLRDEGPMGGLGMSTLFDTREVGLTAEERVAADLVARRTDERRLVWTPPTAEEMDLLGW